MIHWDGCAALFWSGMILGELGALALLTGGEDASRNATTRRIQLMLVRRKSLLIHSRNGHTARHLHENALLV